MNLATPVKIRQIQIKLYQKAKKEPDFRFYQLYDKVYRADILEHAYRLAKANDGAPGPDGESFEDIESSGREKWLDGLRKELHEKTYRAQPVRRKMIAKHGGGERPLGIPNIRDRVVQTAAKLILEPIWEADLEPNAYGYRPRRSAQEAVEKVQELLRAGYGDVVDADLSKYFDTIPHSELMQSVRRRIVDRQMLHLIKMWLTAPVEEKEEKTGKKRLTGGKGNDRGTPQGGVVTPLTQKVILVTRRLGTCLLRRTRGDGDAVANSDGVLTYQNVFDHEPDDSLALTDTKRLRGTAQAREECCDGFCQAQECFPTLAWSAIACSSARSVCWR
jgi:RNA-directed DNA polymerase